MTTEKQIAANRLNALQSTGPQSEDGKYRASQNAIKHGVFSQELIIVKGDGREDKSEFDCLLAELVEDLQPIGKMEALLVEKIAVNYWRLRRLMKYECGRIRDLLDDYRESAILDYYDSGNLSDIDRALGITKPEKPLMKHFHLLDNISEQDMEMQESRLMALDRDRNELVADEDFIKFILNSKLKKEVDRPGDEDIEIVRKYLSNMSPQQFGRLRNTFLDIEADKLQEMEEVVFWQKRFEILGRIRAIPGGSELEKISKYETSLERSIFRNLAALQELQKRRN